jgi:tRNA nucleotidyltransferase (CCA-adding enzyme)
MNLSDRIEKSISVTRRGLLRLVAEEAAARRLPLYAVGGFARDLSLERGVQDFDLVVEGDALPFARALARQHGGRVTVHARFHTATWFLPPHLTSFDAAQGRPDTSTPGTLDLISARSETYEHPAALPTIKLGTLADDLRRRDFTINALAIRLDGEGFGELRDDLNGMSDLEHGLIRVLHPKSFMDDPTRLFRAVRYAGRYGFQIESGTAALIPAASPYVEQLSPERLRHELDLIFEEQEAVPMLENLWAYGILQPVRPALPSDEAVRVRFEKTRAEKDRGRRWMVWLMGLSEQEIRALARRLHFTAELTKRILAASSVFHDLDFFKGLRPSQCVARLDGLPEASILAAALCAPSPGPRSMLEKYAAKWKNVKPFTTGEMLQEMGLPFGPRIGETLWRLRAAWLDGEVKSEEEEIRLLEEEVRRK